jgi:competence protein ComEC
MLHRGGSTQPSDGRPGGPWPAVPRSAGFAALAGSAAVLAGPWMGEAWLAVLALLGAFLALSAGVLAAPLRRSRWWAPLLSMSVAGAASAAVAWDQSAQRWPPRLSGERVIAEVLIDDLPSVEGGTLEADVRVSIEAPRALQRTLRLRLVWRGAPRPVPRAGERWRLLLRVDALPGILNPGGPDLGRAAARTRTQGRATVIDSPANLRIAAAGQGLDPLRERIAHAIRDTVEDRDAAALFAGLAVGATGSMTREQWQVFSATGTTHLVAISGMHVTLFAWLAAGLGRRAWTVAARRAARRPLRVGREPFAAMVGLGAALGYALLAGFGIPTQRTVVMLAAWWVLRLGGREQGGFEALGWALLAVLAIDPLAPLSSGFWLSFGAMAVLLAGDLERGARARGAVRELLVTQWRVGLALAPLTIAWFGSLSLAGFLVNLVAIPVISFLLVPLVLAGMAVPLAWQAAERLHAIGWPWMQAAAEWPGAVLAIDADPWRIVLLVALLPVWLLPVPARWRLASLGALLPWVAAAAGWPPRADRPPPGEARVTLFDAGDAFALSVQTRHRALLVDTAASHTAPRAGATSRIVPALRSAGIERLDMLVLSLAHGFRAAGAAQVLAAIEVRAARAGGGWPGAPPPVQPCGAPERWRWDGVDFELRAATLPEGSCVLRIAMPGGPVMLVAERLDAAEGAALMSSGAPLGADVVVAPRRGSPAALAPGFTGVVGARRVLVAARAVSARRQATLAARWDVPPQSVHVTAGQGALSVRLRPGMPPEVSRHVGRWRAEPPSHAALGYDSTDF